MDLGDLRVEQWSAFFSSTAQVSGGLVGLVFVALTFKPGLLGDDGEIGLRKLARQTFGDFLNVLLISLIMLVPYSRSQIVFFLVIVGLLGVQRVVRSLWEIHRAMRKNPGGKPTLQRFLLSLIGNGALLTAGISIALQAIPAAAFWGLVFGGIMTLVTSGSRSAWLLVTHDSG